MYLRFVDAKIAVLIEDWESAQAVLNAIDAIPGTRGLLWYGDLENGQWLLWSADGDIEAKLAEYSEAHPGTEVLPLNPAIPPHTASAGYWTIGR